MPVTLEAGMVMAEAAERPRKRWTREECSLLEKAGVGELSQYELIEGELIRKMSKNPPHVYCLHVASKLLRAIFGYDAVLQDPSIDVSPEDTPTSAPEPDLVLLRNEGMPLASRIRAADIRLVVEVSDTTLRFDLFTKAPLYARAGITEYWVLDLNTRRVFVHREPVQGSYTKVTVYSSEERVATLAAPEAEFAVADLFPVMAAEA